MEYDRYKGHHKLYVFGIICLILCLSFFFFSMYILPFLIWGEHYDVPDFISTLFTYFEERYQYSAATSSLLVWLLFFIPCLITGWISYYISNRIDNGLLGIQPKVPERNQAEISMIRKREMRESASLGLKILSLMIVIVLAILLLQFIL